MCRPHWYAAVPRELVVRSCAMAGQVGSASGSQTRLDTLQKTNGSDDLMAIVDCARDALTEGLRESP